MEVIFSVRLWSLLQHRHYGGRCDVNLRAFKINKLICCVSFSATKQPILVYNDLLDKAVLIAKNYDAERFCS